MASTSSFISGFLLWREMVSRTPVFLILVLGSKSHAVPKIRLSINSGLTKLLDPVAGMPVPYKKTRDEFFQPKSILVSLKKDY